VHARDGLMNTHRERERETSVRKRSSTHKGKRKEEENSVQKHVAKKNEEGEILKPNADRFA